VDRFKEHRKRPLLEHLHDWEQSLADKGNTACYVKMKVSRARRIIKGCAFHVWTDISASRIQKFVADLRSGQENISAQTHNFYLQAIQQFCRWMVKDSRAAESPIEHLGGLNVRTDRRHDRRALGPDEVRKLLEATKAAPVRFRMTGYQRALAYRLAIESGLRAREIRSLTVSSFDFDNCTVSLTAAYSKRRRQDELPLRRDTAKELGGFLVGKLPNVQVFPIPAKPCKMLKPDRKSNGDRWEDDSGRRKRLQTSLQKTCKKRLLWIAAVVYDWHGRKAGYSCRCGQWQRL